MHSKNALGNLKNRYKAVLKKCHLLNTFGTLLVVSALLIPPSSAIAADDLTIDSNQTVATGDTLDAGTVTLEDAAAYNISVAGTLNANVMQASLNASSSLNGTSSSDSNYVYFTYAGGKLTDNGEINIEDVYLTLTDVVLQGRYYAGSYAGGENSTSTVNSSTLTVTGATSVASGTRLYGAGAAHGTNSSIYHDSTSVTVSGVEGSFNIYGGGEARASNSSYQSPQIIIGSTEVLVQDSTTGYIFGGSVTSGTTTPDKTSLVVTGNTSVTLDNTNVTSGYVVGGNYTNYFGYSVIGVVAEEGDEGAHEFNGSYYTDGSTKIVLTNGSVLNYNTIGGSFSSYASYTGESGARESVVFGTTEILIEDATTSSVYGGGFADYYNSNSSPSTGGITDAGVISNVIGSTSIVLSGDSSSYALYGGGRAGSYYYNYIDTIATVEGTTSITIEGGTVRTNVVGGGLAYHSGDVVPSVQGDTIASVYGDTYVNMSNGTVYGSVIGGGLANGMETTSDVSGSTNITISGGEIQGDLYGGGYAYGLNASATVDTVNITVSGGEIQGALYGGGYAEGTNASATVETVNITVSGGEFSTEGGIYAGGYAYGESATADVAGTATVTFSGTANTGTVTDGYASLANAYEGLTVYGTGYAVEDGSASVGTSVLSLSEYYGTFNATIVDFDKVQIVNNTNLTLASATVIDSAFVADGTSTITADISLFDPSDTVALTANTIDVEAGAKVYLTGVTLDAGTEQSFNIAATTESDGLTIASGAWGYGDSGETFTFDNELLTFVSSELEGNAYSVTLSRLNATSVVSSLDTGLGTLVDNMDLTATENLTQFVKKAVSSDANPVSLENAVSMSAAGGSTQITQGVGNVALGNVSGRTSISTPSISSADPSDNMILLADSGAIQSDAGFLRLTNLGGAYEDGYAKGLGIWFAPMYQHTSANGFQSGNHEYGYNTDIYGGSLGLDYTFNSNLRLGASLHAGAGTSESKGDYSGSENDFDYLGFTLYSGYVYNNFGISADFGYTGVNSDVKQSNNGSVLKSDFATDMISLGATLEYKFATEVVDIVPSVGIRYTHTGVQDFTTSVDGYDSISSKNDSMSTVTFPVNLSLSKEVKTDNGLTLLPKANVGVTFAAGDKEMVQEVAFSTVAGSTKLTSEVIDPVTFNTGIGLDLQKDNFTFSLDYGLDLSKNVVNNKVMGTFRYQF